METSIGSNAGKIWEQLTHANEPATPAALAKSLGLKASDVDRALGWLAREGKLAFDTSKKNSVLVSIRS